MSAQDFTDIVNANRGGFDKLVGLRFVRCTVDEVCAEIELGPQHHQPYGLTHGGVYCSMIEAMCSVAAAVNAMPQGKTTVGLENTTSFLRAVRTGTLHGRATPLTRGKRTHVWEVAIRDDDDRLVASGRVRMICLEAGAMAGGEQVALKTPKP